MSDDKVVTALGLMSGTSLDGIDAAVVRIRGRDPTDLDWEVLGFRTRPYSSSQREAVAAAIAGASAAEICRLRVDLAEWNAQAAIEACRSAGLESWELDVVGYHGQTIWHDPPGSAASRQGASLQLGDPATLSERLGAPIVSDFRAQDLAAGGQGAPLVPWPDRVLFSAPHLRRVLQNLGGMGNVTWLPPRSAAEPLLAFDTGPGVALIDAAVQRATGGVLAFDVGGELAGAGRADEGLLSELMRHPFLERPPPRSTGREIFGPGFVETLAAGMGLDPSTGDAFGGDAPTAWKDLIATLTIFTARTIAEAYRRWVVPKGIDEIYLAGGGARNPALARALRRELRRTGITVPIAPLDDLGVGVDAREAVAFALLAWAHLEGIPANVPEATGAAGPRVLGSYTPAWSEPWTRRAGKESPRRIEGRSTPRVGGPARTP